MNAMEVLIATGRLEVRLQSQEEVLKELLNFRLCILNDNLCDAAISIGRLTELSKDCDEDVKTEVDALSSYIAEQNESSSEYTSEQKEVLKKNIEELNFSVRTFNCLTRAGKKTVKDLVNTTAIGLKKVRNLGKKGFDEVNEKLKELKFAQKDPSVFDVESGEEH